MFKKVKTPLLISKAPYILKQSSVLDRFRLMPIHFRIRILPQVLHMLENQKFFVDFYFQQAGFHCCIFLESVIDIIILNIWTVYSLYWNFLEKSIKTNPVAQPCNKVHLLLLSHRYISPDSFHAYWQLILTQTDKKLIEFKDRIIKFQGPPHRFNGIDSLREINSIGKFIFVDDMWRNWNFRIVVVICCVWVRGRTSLLVNTFTTRKQYGSRGQRMKSRFLL